MFLEITTTVTTKIQITDDGIGEVNHSLSIDASEAEGLPQDAIYAAVLGGLHTSEKTVEGIFSNG